VMCFLDLCDTLIRESQGLHAGTRGYVNNVAESLI
jgi:hypothetical protein